MAFITITEALAELKTLEKRIKSKRDTSHQYLTLLEGVKDPMLKEGGSAIVIQRERQAINDLELRFVNIRTAIQKANLQTEITVSGVTKTIAEWLTWRKEIADGAKQFIATARRAIQQARLEVQKRGGAVVPAGQQAQQATDLIVNVDEALLAKEAETLETILGTLDGLLSLKNATVTIDI